MFFKLFILFAVMPIVEIALLLEVGDMIGGWTTLAIVILTAFIGAKLVREQGISTIQSIQQQTAQGEIPAQSLVEGLMLLVAGVLLVTPGFVTDALGFLLVVPFTRKPLAHIFSKNVQSNVAGGQGFQFHHGFQKSTGRTFEHEFTHAKQSSVFQQQVNDKSSTSESSGSTIEGEYQRKD